MAESRENHQLACLSCGEVISGNYCANCGEKPVHANDLALSHLAHDFWHEVTHLDGKIFGTFRALLFRPGQLTADYWAGRRGRWMRPLRIFLIVTALSLILTPQAAGPLGMKVFTRQGVKGTELTIAVREVPFKAQSGVHLSTTSSVQDGALKIGLDRTLDAEQAVQLNERIHKIYKVIQYLGLAICAGLSLLLGRKVQPYYGGHLILALHYYCFIYFVTGVATLAHLHPLIALLTRFSYLAITMWRLIGGGRQSARGYGVDWPSLWRTAILFVGISFSEIVGLGLSSAIALGFSR